MEFSSLIIAKLPSYQVEFSASQDIEQQAHTCIAWTSEKFRATVVDVNTLTSVFPILSCYSMTMVHLWAVENILPTPLSCTVISWAGISAKNSLK